MINLTRRPRHQEGGRLNQDGRLCETIIVALKNVRCAGANLLTGERHHAI